MTKTKEIASIYASMETSELAERLASGEVSDEAMKIGFDILRKRGVDPENLISEIESKSAVQSDESIIKGKSAKACPFCGSRSIDGGWKPKCRKCEATYEYSLFERFIFILVAIWTYKSYRSGNSAALWIGISFYVVVLIIYLYRGSIYGTWTRGKKWVSAQEFKKLQQQLTEMTEADQFVALMSAIRIGHSNNAFLLLDNNPYLADQYDSEGRSPLLVAVKERRTDVVRKLISIANKSGIRIVISDDLLKIAKNTRDNEIINLLSQYAAGH